MENSLPKVPAHLVSLAGERALRMRVATDAPLAPPVAIPPTAAQPFAVIDLVNVRPARPFGLRPE